jgi:hypothetical protein
LFGFVYLNKQFNLAAKHLNFGEIQTYGTVTDHSYILHKMIYSLENYSESLGRKFEWLLYG